MNRRAAAFILGLALALLAGGALWWWLQGLDSGGPEGGPAGTDAKPASVPFDLWIPEGIGLRTEHRELQVTSVPKDRIRRITETLLTPRPDGARLFPEGVALAGVQLSKDGTAYVNLVWEGHEDPPPSGSTEELQRVYSLVNSITTNVPEARQVVLLWNGYQRPTFSGHLDTSRPLPPFTELRIR
jgi:Sporulation and spore germination